MPETENQSKLVLAIDPGTEVSGWVYGDPTDKARPVQSHGITANSELRSRLLGGEWLHANRVVIEQFVSYGRPLGDDSLTTVRWIGRFEEVIRAVYGEYPATLPRRRVKQVLCDTANAKDPDVTRALVNLYGPGRSKAIGKKAAPGPLYGIVSHEWQALGVAVAFVWIRAWEKAQGKLFEFDTIPEEPVMT